MPAIIPFIPLIAAGVGAGATVYAAKKSASTAERLARPVEAAGQAQTEQARQQFGLGSPAVRQAMSYYQTLLTGSRGQMQQLTAGPRGAITDVYSGAARGLERSGVRGAERDVARGEIGRQQAGQIASLTTGIQPHAAGALGDIGLNLTGQGGSNLAGAAGTYGNLLGQQLQQGRFQYGADVASGEAIGKVLTELLKWYGQRGSSASASFQD